MVSNQKQSDRSIVVMGGCNTRQVSVIQSFLEMLCDFTQLSTSIAWPSNESPIAGINDINRRQTRSFPHVAYTHVSIFIANRNSDRNIVVMGGCNTRQVSVIQCFLEMLCDFPQLSTSIAWPSNESPIAGINDINRRQTRSFPHVAYTHYNNVSIFIANRKSDRNIVVMGECNTQQESVIQCFLAMLTLFSTTGFPSKTLHHHERQDDCNSSSVAVNDYHNASIAKRNRMQLHNIRLRFTIDTLW